MLIEIHIQLSIAYNCQPFGCNQYYNNYKPLIHSRRYHPFICHFDGNDCGFESQNNLLKFQRIDGLINLSTKEVMVLNASDTNNTCAYGGRLISPKISSYSLSQV